MKTLKAMAFALAALTAVVVSAGFKTGETSQAPTEGDPVFEELKDNRPFTIRCLFFDGAKFHTVAYATGCTPLENSSCILTVCPGGQATKDMKVVLAKCVRGAVTVAYSNGCRTSANAFCTVSSCPPGTSVVMTP
jgi:hypothetical protein